MRTYRNREAEQSKMVEKPTVINLELKTSDGKPVITPRQYLGRFRQFRDREHKLDFTGYSKRNKTRTSKVGAISKAQKAQNIFFAKKLVIFESFSLSVNVAHCRKM